MNNLGTQLFYAIFWVFYWLFYPIRYLVSHLRTRYLLSVSTVKTFDSFELYALVNDEKSRSFFNLAIESLNLLSQIDPLRFKRVKKNLKRIAFLKQGCGYYDPHFAAFIVDSFREDDAVLFSSAIVQAATHGYLRSKGISYNKRSAERLEKLCVKEQLRFIKRVIDLKKEWSQEEKVKQFQKWADSFDRSLERRPWEFHRRIGQQLKTHTGTFPKVPYSI